MTDKPDPLATAYTIIGPEGIHEGTSWQRYPHTIAADALREATSTTWQTVEYRELEPGIAWDVEGLNDSGDRSGPYRLTIAAKARP